MYLFFDTETNGLPDDWNAPIEKVDNWPRIIQIAWAKYDKQGNEISCRADIIKPSGFAFQREAAKIHGITEKVAMNGNNIKKVLEEFTVDIKVADCIVAHNTRFDKKIIRAELLRLEKDIEFISREKIETICTMFSSTAHCAIPGPRGNKWPKLEELYKKLFNEDLVGAHDALVDVRACARCFFELRRLGVIENE